MRFISKFGEFGVQIRPMIQEAYATGMAKVLQEPVYVFFKPWHLRPEERELAVSAWQFNGSYQNEDEVTLVPPDHRIGLFDSEEAQIEKAWTDEIRLEVERELTRLAERYGDIIVVPRTTVPPPWPRYDDYVGSPEDLVAKLREDGHDLDATLTYEKAMQNRPEVVAALEEASSGRWADFDAVEEEIVG